MSASGKFTVRQQSAVINGTWIFLLLLAIADAALLIATGVHLPPKTLPFTLSIFAAIAVLSATYCYLRRDIGIYIGLQITNQMIIGTLLLAGFSYLTSWFAFPFIDAQLEACDHLLRLNWLNYVQWINSNPLLALLFQYCYDLTGMEIPLLLVLLFLLKQIIPVQRFAVGFLGSGFCTVALAAVWPARPAFAYYHIPASAYPNIDIANALRNLQDLYAMRAHSLAALPDTFEGIVEFPSFHSAIAILVICAARYIPFVGLRYLLIVVNIIMLCSTPVNGGHYFIDTFAGISLGMMAVIATQRLIPFEKTAKDGKEYPAVNRA